MPQTRSVKVIINAGSGFSDKEDVRRQLIKMFEAAGIAADISLAETGDDIVELARAAAGDDWSTIVVGGGDGTINAVASALIGSEKILGVLPLGTLNHFAKDLGIPLDLEGAARVVISGHTRAVDVGEVNGRTFLNNSSLGLYPMIVRERKRKQRQGSAKWPAFVWAAIAAFRRYPFLNVSLMAEGKHYRLKTPSVFVGNNKYVMEGFNIGRREHLDEGQLSVYITNRAGRWGLLRLAVRALLGHLREEKDFLALLTDELEIRTRHKRLRVAFDGEVDTLEVPLLYSVRPRVLRVTVPSDNND
jgi:YegS/Rv2252/BmrU family lipid kinase